MGEVVKMKDISLGRVTSVVEWVEVKHNKDGYPVPLKIWENLEPVLEANNIKVALNLINHEIDYIGLEAVELRNNKVTDIYSLQVKEGLNLSRDETFAAIKRIAEKNSYNPFVDMLIENENDDLDIIYDVFDCLNITLDAIKDRDYYKSIFLKWCLNVVKLSHNTLANDWGGQGVLVLQGGQGCYKSTFCRKLMPQKEWFKGDKSLDPEKVDSVIQNTTYVLVEWGELDSTLKGEQSKLKQFITATNDEYRSPYDRLPEKYPRLTSYIGTVNKKDFLKDETGSRRFWIIPVTKCDVDKLDTIDMKRFWGAVYSLWKVGSVKEYLTVDEQAVLQKINSNYNYENDISIALDDKIDWQMPEEEWTPYKPTEIADYLYVRETKKLKIELEKRGIFCKVYNKNGKTIRGYKIPRIELRVF